MSIPADKLLHDLLDSHERKPMAERRSRIMEDVPVTRSLDDLDAMRGRLGDAVKGGAIQLVMGKKSMKHVMDHVVLLDPDRLYGFLGRKPLGAISAAAADRLQATPATSREARQIRDSISSAWREGLRWNGVSHQDGDIAHWIVLCLDAVIGKEATDMGDMRSFSTRMLGNSKIIERHWSRVCAGLRETGFIPQDAGDETAKELVNLAKFPQPILMSGHFSLAGMSMANLVYIGIPPDHIPEVGLLRQIQAIVTVENLASFNRLARECRHPEVLAVYTAGWPTMGVIGMLKRLTGLTEASIHHWGDIDPAGVAIGNHLHAHFPGRVKPHLMSESLAREHGHEPAGVFRYPSIPESSPFADLWAFIRSREARHMEQETLAPSLAGLPISTAT